MYVNNHFHLQDAVFRELRDTDKIQAELFWQIIKANNIIMLDFIQNHS